MYPEFIEMKEVQVFSLLTRRITAYYVDNAMDLASCCELAENSATNMIAVDCEGLDLSKVGKLCFVQIAVPNEAGADVYLIDVNRLLSSGSKLIELKRLLEAQLPLKLLWDCRNDSGALFSEISLHTA